MYRFKTIFLDESNQNFSNNPQSQKKTKKKKTKKKQAEQGALADMVDLEGNHSAVL